MYTAIAMDAVCMGGNLTQARRGGVFNTTGPLRDLSEYASRLDNNRVPICRQIHFWCFSAVQLRSRDLKLWSILHFKHNLVTCNVESKLLFLCQNNFVRDYRLIQMLCIVIKFLRSYKTWACKLLNVSGACCFRVVIVSNLVTNK